jgi:hypothetical protein
VKETGSSGTKLKINSRPPKSILTLPKAFESREMNSLVKTADVWLKSLNVYHNEHHFVNKKKNAVDRRI